MVRIMRACVVVLIVGAVVSGGSLPPVPAIFGGRSVMDAHNAYPESAKYRDRLARAMGTGLVPLVIEQDLVYNQKTGETVVAHDVVLDGSEPTLQQHFFDRIADVMEGALRVGATDHWPMLVLHLDFKTNERAHHRAVWDLLQSRAAWLTTAPVSRDATQVTAFKPGPLLVLTENGAEQEQDFTVWAAESGSYLLFGSIPGPSLPPTQDERRRSALLAQAAPGLLIPSGATSYRRWVNFPWSIVEEGGQPAAGAWTREDDARLTQVVGYAHERGLLIRFYTLNGHPPAASQGWSAGYNFGNLDAVRQRWRAAIRAHVDLIATDQYEEFALFQQSLE